MYWAALYFCDVARKVSENIYSYGKATLFQLSDNVNEVGLIPKLMP